MTIGMLACDIYLDNIHQIKGANDMSGNLPMISKAYWTDPHRPAVRNNWLIRVVELYARNTTPTVFIRIRQAYKSSYHRFSCISCTERQRSGDAPLVARTQQRLVLLSFS